MAQTSKDLGVRKKGQTWLESVGGKQGGHWPTRGHWRERKDSRGSDGIRGQLGFLQNKVAGMFRERLGIQGHLLVMDCGTQRVWRKGFREQGQGIGID